MSLLPRPRGCFTFVLLSAAGLLLAYFFAPALLFAADVRSAFLRWLETFFP